MPTVNFHFLPQYIYKSVQAQHKLPTHSCWRVSPVPLDRVGWSSHCQCYSCQHKIAFRRHSTRVGWSTHKLAEWDLQHFLATVKLKWAAVYICKSTHNIYKNYIDVILYSCMVKVSLLLFVYWLVQASVQTLQKERRGRLCSWSPAGVSRPLQQNLTPVQQGAALPVVLLHWTVFRGSLEFHSCNRVALRCCCHLCTSTICF